MPRLDHTSGQIMANRQGAFYIRLRSGREMPPGMRRCIGVSRKVQFGVGGDAARKKVDVRDGDGSISCERGGGTELRKMVMLQNSEFGAVFVFVFVKITDLSEYDIGYDSLDKIGLDETFTIRNANEQDVA